MSPEKLVLMANQIGKAFAHEGEERAVAAVADHLRKFWDPRMRAALREHAQAGATELDPWVLRGVIIGTQAQN